MFTGGTGLELLLMHLKNTLCVTHTCVPYPSFDPSHPHGLRVSLGTPGNFL